MATKSKPTGTPREGVNTRLTADLRAKLAAAAEAAGRSVGAEIERRLLASFTAQPPSLTAEDVRQVVREEMAAQRVVTVRSARDDGMENAKPISTPALPDGGHVHIAADQGEGPFTPGARADRQICRNRGCAKPDLPWMCGRPDCAQGL